MSVYSVALCASLCLSGQLAAGDKPAADRREGPFEQPVGAVTGLWATQPRELAPSHWKAHWIWEDTAVQQNTNRMVLARKRFVLDDAPRNARLHITADSSYQLFVNGVFVVRGPARCAPHHQSFDVVDVARLLKPGTNVLAVRVHHAGLARSYHQPSRPGLLVQLEVASDQSTRTIRTDTTWKMLPDPRWDTGSPRINRWHAGYVDIVDLRKGPGAWKQPAFDDSAWPNAVAIKPSGWWPKPQPDAIPRAITLPWVELVGRDLPYLTEARHRAENIVSGGRLAGKNIVPAPESSRDAYRFDRLPLPRLPRVRAGQIDDEWISGVEAYREEKSPIVIRCSSDKGSAEWILFDFGRVFNGRPRLEIQGPAGTVVDVLSVPYLLDQFVNARILDSRHSDRVILSGELDSWESFYFKPVRYMALVVRGSPGPVRIAFAGVTSIEYPFEYRGSFTTPDLPWLDAFWRAGTNTVQRITTDAFTDNYRERRQYAQTSYYAAKGNYAAFGDIFLQRRYLNQIAQEQEPNGIVPAYAPLHDDRFMVIFESELFWITGWHDYALYSGDLQFVRRLLPTARRIMDRVAELTNSDGLIDAPPYPYWIDHSFIDRRGANFVLNAFHVLALDDYAETLAWLDEGGEEAYRRQAAELRTVLREKFWNKERRLFTDAIIEGQQSSRLTEHANGIALAADIASPEQAKMVVPVLLRKDNGLVPVTSLFMHWIFMGLCRTGHVDDALSMLQTRFEHILVEGSGTLWEAWHLDRTRMNGREQPMTWTDAQGECGFAPMALTRWIGGLEVLAPGVREVMVRRIPCKLHNLGVVLPSPLGELHVAWRQDAGALELELDVPSGMLVKLDLASVAVPDQAALILDGQPQDLSGSRTGFYVIPQGRHRLRFPRNEKNKAP